MCYDKVLNRGLLLTFICEFRFCLDRNDKGAESEEEILAEEDHDDGEEDEVEEEQDPGNPPSPRK